MNKRKIRCYSAYVEAGGIYNNLIYYLAQDGYRLSLVSCIRCGELFVIDWENPQITGMNIAQISRGQFCPKCNAELSVTLRNYPENFIGRNMQIGTYIPSTWIPPSEQSTLVEVWEIFPTQKINGVRLD